MSDYEDYPPRRGGGWMLGLLFILAILVAAGTYVHYEIEPIVHIGDKDLAPWEVVGGLLIGLVVGLIGLIVALFAGILGIGAGIAGAGLGLFITVGVLVGPFLLAWIIFKSIRGSKTYEEI